MSFRQKLMNALFFFLFFKFTDEKQHSYYMEQQLSLLA